MWKFLSWQPTPDAIKALLAESRHDVAILPQLEAYCAGPSYDLDANLATLKLYQFHPEALKVPVVATILAKALARLPETDYLACTYLVSDAVQQQAPISTIATVAGLLETCSFREFWAAAEPHAGRIHESRTGRKG